MAQHVTTYHSIKVDGLNIFYREAGPKDAPTLLLLHGLPSSSRMFQPLLTRLAGEFHLIAPDYPGFGHSDWPPLNALSSDRCCPCRRGSGDPTIASNGSESCTLAPRTTTASGPPSPSVSTPRFVPSFARSVGFAPT